MTAREDVAGALLCAADVVETHPRPIPAGPATGGFWWDEVDLRAVATLLRWMASETAEPPVS